MIRRYADSLHARSLLVPRILGGNMGRIAAAWFVCSALLAMVKLATSPTPIHKLADAMPIIVAYSAVIIAPICGYFIAHRAFVAVRPPERLAFHLSFPGRWKRIGIEEARAHPLFGPVGFLASLLIGLLLNVVVRTGEYLVAVPAMGAHAPDWGMAIFVAMTADVVIMSFFYMVAFVMALRSIPLFPRMLLYAWLVDVFMQLIIASYVAGIGTVPARVETPLIALLQGNVTKVLISVAVWMPYLIMSQRVNLTYRSRIAA